MGDDAEDMLFLFGLSVKNKNKYEIVKDNLKCQFINQRVQRRGSSVNILSHF